MGQDILMRFMSIAFTGFGCMCALTLEDSVTVQSLVMKLIMYLLHADMFVKLFH